MQALSFLQLTVLVSSTTIWVTDHCLNNGKVRVLVLVKHEVTPMTEDHFLIEAKFRADQQTARINWHETR